MATVNATKLAELLGVSTGRVSQYVSEGKLDGCYAGVGRARRFDLEKCAAALDRKLDLGQRLGNGAASAEALRGLPLGDAPAPTTVEPDAREPGIPRSDPDADRYQKARADMAETRAIKERIALAEVEGRYVLASEVELRVRRAIAEEVAGFESVLRSGAQTIAAEHGLEARVVKAVLVAAWRSHRARRAQSASGQADAAELSEAEMSETVAA